MDLSRWREPSYAGYDGTDASGYFTPLIDLKNHLNKKVQILGVIVEFGLPRKSKGTDYCINVKVIDESQQQPELSVNIFSDRFDKLPNIQWGRDIILLHQVQIVEFHGEVRATFNKAFSTYAIFDGKLDSGTSPYQMYPNFFLHDPWRRLVVNLRKWSASFQFDAGNTDYLVPLKDIKEDFIDLVGMVSGVHEVSNNVWVLFLWDGTDVPPLSLNTDLEEEISTLPLPENILGKFPVIGTVFKVMIDEARAKFVRHFQDTNQWVKIRNLLCKTTSGTWIGVLTNTSKVRLLTGNANSAEKCFRKFAERLEKWHCKPMSSYNVSNFLTVTKDGSAKLATLVYILSRSADKTKWTCIVRVLAVHPSTGTYKIRMTLEDPTARLNALLCAEDVDLFFGENQSPDVLTAKRNKLLGVLEEGGSSTRNPPWIMCCIEVNVPQDTASGDNNKVFRLCNTVLV